MRINYRLGGCFKDWSSVGGNGQTAVQTYDQVLRNVQADFFASHYNRTAGPMINHWEVWNEPNAWTSNPTPGLYSGGSFIYPSNFAALVSQARNAITAATANPTALVVSGGLLGLDARGHGRSGLSNGYKSATTSACPSSLPSGGDYLCSTYDMGRKYEGWTNGHSPFDVIGQHLYINQGGTATGNAISRYLNDLRGVYESYGGEPAARQTQVTEFGWSSGSVSLNTQAKNLQVAYQTFKGNSVRRSGVLVSDPGPRRRSRLLRVG